MQQGETLVKAVVDQEAGGAMEGAALGVGHVPWGLLGGQEALGCPLEELRGWKLGCRRIRVRGTGARLHTGCMVPPATFPAAGAAQEEGDSPGLPACRKENTA